VDTKRFRRQLAVVVLACAAGAVLALVAAARPWAVELAVRPAPLPDLRTERTGGDRYPWLPALAWVGLAGAGAVLATRGTVRRLLGGLLMLAGAGVVAGAAGGAGAGGSPVWPVLAGLGGLAVVAAGAAAVLRGSRWPAMSARYERPASSPEPPTPEPAAPGPAVADREGPAARPELLWDALDRGEDPTAR
jgi:hypothetical protein